MRNLNALTNGDMKRYGKTYTVVDSLDSTNNYIKNHADILSDGHVVIASEQLSGRGRQGKSFYSPQNEGLYMSLLVKNEKQACDELFTVKISLAVCFAIDRITGTDNNNGVGIKWVNDIYFGKKKLCGILCERFRDDNGKTCVVAGVGVNLRLTNSAVPKELRSIVTSLFDMTKHEYDKYELCSLICEELERVMLLSNEDVLAEYKRRSIVIGREINILRENSEIRAAALDICQDGSLLVRTEEGYTQKLCGGEISIRIKK